MDVITMARELGKELQQTASYKAFDAAKAAADQDGELQRFIGEFNLCKMNLSSVMQGEDKDVSRTQTLNAELRSLYDQITARPAMIAYNTAKDVIDREITFIQQILIGAANGEDPDSIQEQPACTGSCDSCSGCH